MKVKITSCTGVNWYNYRFGEIVDVESIKTEGLENADPAYYYFNGNIELPIKIKDCTVQLSPFHDRLINEQLQLKENIDKLESFITGIVFNQINPFQKSLLLIQLEAMKTYNQCLIQRLDWLNNVANDMSRLFQSESKQDK
jgi:hypothetical protein